MSDRYGLVLLQQFLRRVPCRQSNRLCDILRGGSLDISLHSCSVAAAVRQRRSSLCKSRCYPKGVALRPLRPLLITECLLGIPIMTLAVRCSATVAGNGGLHAGIPGGVAFSWLAQVLHCGLAPEALGFRHRMSFHMSLSPGTGLSSLLVRLHVCYQSWRQRPSNSPAQKGTCAS